MKFYAEKLGQYFDSAEACESAEKEYEEKLAAEKKQKEEMTKDRGRRASEVQEAYEAFKNAEKNYYKLRNQFIKDYHYYHTTYSSTEDLEDFDLVKLWDELFGWGKLI